MPVVPTHIGAYRLLRKLGEGGMGSVYEALQEKIERRVAIKIVLPAYAHDGDITKRFFNEARAVNLIDHPSIVQIHEHGNLPDGTAYIVMEFIKGDTLAERMKKLGGRMPVQQVVQIIWQVAAALMAAHQKSIVHRDLKPTNLMLIPDQLVSGGERVKVLDFGIAKLAADVYQAKTATSMVMGTPTYMSPEQCRGAGAVDEKTDVYALGVILFEMLVGRPPFVAAGAGELLGMHLFQPPPAIAKLVPGISSDLADFAQRLLCKDKAQRPSMREVFERLTPASAFTSEPVLAAVKTPNSPAQKRLALLPILLGSASLAAAGLLFFLLVWLSTSVSPKAPLRVPTGESVTDLATPVMPADGSTTESDLATAEKSQPTGKSSGTPTHRTKRLTLVKHLETR